MQLFREDTENQKGSTSIMLTLLMALGLGTSVYLNMDKINQGVKSNKLAAQRDKAELRNISGLSQAEALMQFSGANPNPRDINTLPFIYPDPYLPGQLVGATRTHPGATTWSFQNMLLDIKSPQDLNIKVQDFAGYVTANQRPALSNRSTIKFLSPNMSDTHPDLIESYRSEISTLTATNQTIKTMASVKVAKPIRPSCILTTLDGENHFQPNTSIRFKLLVSGVATEARIPDTTAKLADPSLVAQYQIVNLRDRSDSIRKIDNDVYTWTVPSPRPLFAVDGNGDVAFTAKAYLSSPAEHNIAAAECSFTFYVGPPATCKLWADKATIAPGECVNIKSALIGPVATNSLSLSAEDIVGNPVNGLTQTSSTEGKFCAPNQVQYQSLGIEVAKDLEQEFLATLSTLSLDQKKALYDAFAEVYGKLKELFPSKPVLQGMPIQSYNTLFSLSDSMIENLAAVDLDKFAGLKILSSEQKSALSSLKASDLAPLITMKPIYLDTIDLFVPKSEFAALMAKWNLFPADAFLSILGRHLSEASSSADLAVNYRVVGSVKETSTGQTNTCLAHVTVGQNKCPYFGPSYPTYGEDLTLIVMNNNGVIGRYPFRFTPQSPNWEVEGIAVSPTDVTNCPLGARCFAVDWGNRTPFVVVKDADSASCQATVNLRSSLGCFAQDTKIRMADGTDRSIQLLKDGDQVWNPLRKKAFTIERVTQGPESTPLLEVKSDKGLVKVTSKHPFFTPSGLKTADELQAGDVLVTEAGQYQKVLSVRSLLQAPREWVWNFVMKSESDKVEDHMVLADGVVTGDLYVQESLAKARILQLVQGLP